MKEIHKHYLDTDIEYSDLSKPVIDLFMTKFQNYEKDTMEDLVCDQNATIFKMTAFNKYLNRKYSRPWFCALYLYQIANDFEQEANRTYEIAEQDVFFKMAFLALYQVRLGFSVALKQIGIAEEQLMGKKPEAALVESIKSIQEDTKLSNEEAMEIFLNQRNGWKKDFSCAEINLRKDPSGILTIDRYIEELKERKDDPKVTPFTIFGAQMARNLYEKAYPLTEFVK